MTAPNEQADPSRTDLAEDRTILANERTFAGWMRTSMAAVAIGVGFHALFGRTEPPWLPRAVATVFLLLAIVVIVLAERRATAVMDRLKAHEIETAKPINFKLFTAVVSLSSAAMIVGLWLI